MRKKIYPVLQDAAIAASLMSFAAIYFLIDTEALDRIFSDWLSQ